MAATHRAAARRRNAPATGCAAVRSVGPVPHQRRRLVAERMPGPQHAQEHIEIAAAVGHGSDVERRVEHTDLRKDRLAERHVRAGAELAGSSVLTDGSFAVRLIDPEHAALESAAET